MRISKENYAEKIATASSLQLIVINYELVLDFLDEAKATINNDAEFEKNVKKAHDFLKELTYSLNMGYELSADLFDIYLYINRLFVHKIAKKNSAAIDEAQKLLEILLEGFKTIDENEQIDRMSKVFAGLTYNKKGELDEYFGMENERNYQV